MIDDLDSIVFLGFNSRVVALNRDTGEIVWDWKAGKGRGFVSILVLDQRQMIVSVMGYTYCLDPRSGRELWFNELSGMGIGVASLAAIDRNMPHHHLAAAAAAQQASAAAGAGATGAT